jgi:hypothetical protein
MAQDPLESKIEVLGESIGAFLEGFHMFPSVVHKILLKHGLAKQSAVDGKPIIDRSAWYPLNAWLETHHAIESEIGIGPLFDVGVCIPEHAPFPPHIVDVETAIASADIAYHMNHRRNGVVMFDPATGGMTEGIGHYGYQKVAGERKIVSVCDNPYPCNFDRGILTGCGRRITPRAKVVHQGGSCRKNGDKSCTYVITW